MARRPLQAVVKQNDTYYAIPPYVIVNQTDGFVRIETVCGVPENIFKIAAQMGPGPSDPDFTQDFEVGYLTVASGPGTHQNRHIIVDNWRVRIWR